MVVNNRRIMLDGLMKHKTLTLFLASGLLASTASAETLNNALSHALAVNPTLAAAQSNYEALSA